MLSVGDTYKALKQRIYAPPVFGRHAKTKPKNGAEALAKLGLAKIVREIGHVALGKFVNMLKKATSSKKI